MVGAEAVDQVLLGVVGLAGAAVEPRVRALVDVTGVVAALDEVLHETFVLRIGGADEEVVGGADLLGDLLELRHHLVHMLLGAEPPRAGRLLHLRAVLVGTGEEEDVVAQLAMETRSDVGGRRGVGMADVRHVVDVVDRSGDVEAAHGRLF